MRARDIRPVIPLKLTVNVVKGLHKPPKCEHSVWTFAGSDTKRGASKWRYPKGKCTPASVWVKADRLHTLIPRTTDRWKAIYRTRGAIEREWGRLKHEWGMLPLRVQHLPRHVCILKQAVNHRSPRRTGSHTASYKQNSR